MGGFVGSQPCKADGMSSPIQVDVSVIRTICHPRRRTWFAQMGLSCVWMFSGCKDDAPDMPSPPYGQALDVTQADTVVEFDIRIVKPERYDLVLEIFQKDPKDIVDFAAIKDAYFSVQIQSLADMGGVVLDRDVRYRGGPYDLFSKSGYAASVTEKHERRSQMRFLIKEYSMNSGVYRIRCVNRAPLPLLQGRLVKVVIENRYYPK